MSLPKIDLPTFELELKSSKRRIKFRPYLVKEEKILLMAAESTDAKDIAAATRQVVNNVVLEEGFDISNFPTYECDWIFMNARAKSVGDVIEREYVCQNTPEGYSEPCGNKFTVKLDLKDVKFVDPKLPNEIKFGDNVILMKHTPFKAIETLSTEDSAIVTSMKILHASVDRVFDKEQSYSMRDVSYKEFVEWIDNLDKKTFDAMKNYVDNMPYLILEKEVKCSKCNYAHKIVIRDPVDFFQ